MKNKLKVVGTGDALFVAPFPQNYQEEFLQLKAHIDECDVKMTNLETTLTDFEFCGNAYSGGTWLSTRREYLKHLMRFGFNYYGNANNHAMDYGHDGLLSTVKALDDLGLAHSGTGESLDRAEAPAVLDIDGKKVAIFAVDLSHEPASKAGRATPYLKARPGVNYVGHTEKFLVSKEEMESLKAISKSTKLNFTRQHSIDTGFLNPDPEGTFVMDGVSFTLNEKEATSKCNPKDLKRITDNVKKAKTYCDYAFILAHCHDDDHTSNNSPAHYFREFCRACIDAGASAVFGGGTHELCPIEIYKGLPIFYSLGDFIYQGLKVEYLPADFMEKYGADINITAEEALYVRSRGGKVGLHLDKNNFLSLLPKLEFEGDKMTDLKLTPLYLNFDAKDDRFGLPRIASEDEALEILTKINNLSAPFGTKLKNINGTFEIAND